MTCKDCIHFQACKTMLESQGYVVDGDGHDADIRCKEFQNKADFVEVVRCKDCKYWEFVVDDPIFKRELGNCKCPNWENNDFWCQTWEDNFCSYGERK